MGEPANDWLLPYDSSITAQILDVVEIALIEKTSKVLSSDEKGGARSKQAGVDRKLRVEITTDIDKMRTTISIPTHAALDTFFVDYVWLKIIDLFSDRNERELESDGIDDMAAGIDEFEQINAAWDGDFLFESDSLLDEESEFDPEVEKNEGQPCGFNISISLVSDTGTYFISSYFDISSENLDLAKLIVDGGPHKKKYTATGLKNHPFVLRICLTSLDDPITTNRF